MRIVALAIIALLLFSIIIYGPQNSVFDKATIVSAQTTESAVSERLFNVDLVFAYVKPGASSAIAVLNFTNISNLTLSEGQGITEVYTVQIFSQGQRVSENDKIGGIIGGGKIDGYTMMNLAMDGTFSARGNVGGLESLKILYLNLHPTLNEPISLKLVKVCWIIVNGNSTEVDYSRNEIIKIAEPIKYQNGFLYNYLFPQANLSSVDLFDPLKYYAPSSTPNLSNPSPSPIVLEFSSLAILPLLASTLAAALFLKNRHVKKP
jgi:hypothetical protein